MNIPKKLKIGDTIGIIAPAGKSRSDMEEVRNTLNGYGYKVKIGESCYLNYKGYMAGEDYIRARDLENMFLDKEVDAIMCLRGGYGSTRILDLIDYDIVRDNPKVFIGFSDITALHIVFNQQCNLITYHGIMAARSPIWDKFSYLSLLKAINFRNNLIIKNPPNEEIQVLNDGIANGKLVGGNLALLVASLGTKYEIDTKNKILFIEEIGEYIYRLDRMLNHLYLAGKFEDCNGIIFGDFEDCRKSNSEDCNVEELLEEIAIRCNKPTLYNVKSGHCMPMVTIPLGIECTMDTYSKKIEFKR